MLNSHWRLVICDRFLLSSLAYQGAACPIEWVERINSQAILPDLTIFLEVKPRTASQRRRARGASRELFETDERQRRVSRQYAAAIARRKRRERILTIDGGRPADEVAARAQEEIRCILQRRQLR